MYLVILALWEFVYQKYNPIMIQYIVAFDSDHVLISNLVAYIHLMFLTLPPKDNR